VRRAGKLALTAAAAGLALALAAAPASAAEIQWMKGYDDPDTPNELDRVGVLKTGPRKAKNVLVLNPGTSSSAAYFRPLAETIVRKTRGKWQVWAVERRENQLEDHSMLNRGKRDKATSQEVFDYYLGWLVDEYVEEHFELIPDDEVEFGKGWGMKVEIADLRRVVRAAAKRDRRVVLGGHSLGGTITTAYATWDFGGEAGAKDLAGLIYIDGGSNPTPITEELAQEQLDNLNQPATTPWLAFGGIPAPFTGIFSATGSTGTVVNPDEASLGWSFPLLPANLKPPMQPTNEAQFGYALDAETSPPTLAAAQVNAGHLAASGDPRGWVRAGELTSIQRYADMLSGTGVRSADGTAWYHPTRLTLDGRSVGNGNANPAQEVLDVRATHGDDLRRRTRIYAFGAALGGAGVLDAARVLAEQSDIPNRRLTLVNRENTYTHNDPNSAAPENAFVRKLIPFLRGFRRR
jgi:pimeloyl-ACP methyl ester carboxylesterase